MKPKKGDEGKCTFKKYQQRLKKQQMQMPDLNKNQQTSYA
jgi:hypothetical protein